MNEHELNSKMEKAMANQVPDVLDNILKQCDTVKGDVHMSEMRVEKPRKKKIYKIVAAMAAVLAVVITTVGGINIAGFNKVETIVAFDVNPSIELEVSGQEKVIRVNALNEDAIKILDGMELEKVSLDVAINAILGSMLKQGYISVEQNSILVTVGCVNPERAEQLRQEITADVEQLLSGSNISASVVAQVYEEDSKVENLAIQNKISKSKAKFITGIIDAKLADADGNLYTTEQLAGMTVNQLKLLLESKNIEIDNVVSSGQASESAYLGKGQAKLIALQHAGLSTNAVYDLEVDMDYENGIMVYEVEFETKEYEYEYEINAKTGEILTSQKETADVELEGEENAPPVQKPDNEKPNAGTGNGLGNGNGTGNGAGNGSGNGIGSGAGTGAGNLEGCIGQEAALQAAFIHAGIDRADAAEIACELDKDYKECKYEIEFKAGGFEYSYEIDARTGAVLEFEKEIDD